MNSSELERAEDVECEAQRAAAGRRRVEDAVGRLEAREAVSGAHSAGEWIARWEQLSPGQRFECAERIIADERALAEFNDWVIGGWWEKARALMAENTRLMERAGTAERALARLAQARTERTREQA